jgi:hypothetical protein
MLIQLFFVLAGISNISQAWLFYFSSNPSTSHTALLGFAPSSLEAIRNVMNNMIRAIFPAGLDAVTDPASIPLDPHLSKLNDMIVWTVVLLAGLYYIFMGLTNTYPYKMVSIFASLKLQTAGVLLLIHFFGKPGEWTVLIGISEIVWAILFILVVPLDDEGEEEQTKTKQKRN